LLRCARRLARRMKENKEEREIASLTSQGLLREARRIKEKKGKGGIGDCFAAFASWPGAKRRKGG
jgi:hypothetical protein